jgi:hypothetical protein
MLEKEQSQLTIDVYGLIDRLAYDPSPFIEKISKENPIVHSYLQTLSEYYIKNGEYKNKNEFFKLIGAYYIIKAYDQGVNNIPGEKVWEYINEEEVIQNSNGSTLDYKYKLYASSLEIVYEERKSSKNLNNFWNYVYERYPNDFPPRPLIDVMMLLNSNN